METAASSESPLATRIPSAAVSCGASTASCPSVTMPHVGGHVLGGHATAHVPLIHAQAVRSRMVRRASPLSGLLLVWLQALPGSPGSALQAHPDEGEGHA